MKFARICALLLAAVSAAGGADPQHQELFNTIRSKVLASVKNVPRYTCVETITRTQYAPQGRPACSRGGGKGGIQWQDRIRVDVALLDGAEMFAWRRGRFEAKELGDLVPNGSSGSGDFVSFLASVFGNDAETIQYRGMEGPLAVFDYTVPVERSHYLYHSRGERRTAAYHGSFFADPTSGELRRLSVETEPFAQDENVCEVSDTLDYRSQTIGNGEFLLPDLAVMDVVFRNGEEAHNETRYSECREYVGESSIRFDDADSANASAGAAATSPQGAPSTPMPPGIRLRISLLAPLDQSAAAGDEVVGYVVKDVKAGKAGIVAHTKDRVRGRVLRVEHVFYPSPRWIVRLRFDTLETSGAARTMNLRSVANGPPETFVFPSRGDTIIDGKFQADWETY